MSRSYHVLVNDAAGPGADNHVPIQEIVDAFGRVGIDATVVAATARELPDAMRAAWKQGVDAIVVGGGDGTTNCAAGVAVDDEIVLGILPMGTFNHFAKDLGMPTDLSAAVDFLAAAEATSIDVGEVNGRIFVNNASVGVYPVMVSTRDEIRERHAWGKIRAAPVAIVHTLQRLPVHRLRLTLDDKPPVSVETPFLFVGNGLFDDHGQRLGRRTSLADHSLGVYVIATTSRWRLVLNAIKARFGGLRAAEQTQRQAVEALIVESDEPAIEIALDGEPTHLQVPLHFRSRAGGLRVLAAPRLES
ncbi:MAG: diacylglycerol kinase family protein [Ilumatobacteraceae bacterium]